jgi:two-component system OmpR family response regulator
LTRSYTREAKKEKNRLAIKKKELSRRRIKMAKIMIVDDHKDIVDTLSQIVAKMGHTADTAYNGEEFLNKVGKSKPDLVLLDVMMPGLTTKQILNKLTEKNLGKLKIILVTVVRIADEEKDALLKDSNIVDYVTKPFKVTDLMERIKKQL